MSSPKAPLTVIVATRNEAKNIKQCLDSVSWADQVFVVDSGSTDGTSEIARVAGAEVVQFCYTGGWPKKRNWALASLPIRNSWVLVLDADERVDGALRSEIQTAIEAKYIHGYYVRWRFIFLGRWMRHCWNHGWMLRLLRRGAGEYQDLGMRGEGGWDAEVHENIVVTGRTAKLKSYLTHDTNQDIEYWIKKQNEFSTWNARRRLRATPPISISERARMLISGDPVKIRATLKSIYLRLPMKPILMFIYLYFLKRGFLDGTPGFYFCALRAAHELNIETKVFEASLNLSARTVAKNRVAPRTSV